MLHGVRGGKGLSNTTTETETPKKDFDPFEFETRLPLFQRMGAVPYAESFAHSGLPEFHLYADEVKVLIRWAKTTNHWAAPRILKSLIQEKIDETERGKDARSTMMELGLLHPLAAAMVMRLTKDVGANALDGFHFHYNGHMTRAMFPMFPILEAIGLSEGTATRSSSSGTYPVQGMMNFLLDGKKMRPREVNAIFMGGECETKRVGPFDGQSIHDWMKQCALEAVEKGQTFLVDKGSSLLVNGKFPKELLEPIRKGQIRFLIHNSDDLRELEPHLGEIWAVDVAGSLLKAVEAHVIGEQYALIAAREVREKFGEKIRDVNQCVVGFGLLGWSMADAMARFAMPKDASADDLPKYRKKVIVVESDPDRRKAAEEAGFTVVSEKERAYSGRGVTIVATPGSGVTAANVKHFGDESIFLSCTTGGKGVDLAGMRKAAARESVVRERRGAVGESNKEAKTFADLKLNFGKMAATVVNGGFAVNLLEESWSDRFLVTAAAVIVGVLAAGAIDGPGLHEVPDEHAHRFLRMYDAAKLLTPRALDSNDRGENPALEADLEAFRA